MPRAGLSRKRLIDVAARLADQVGYDKVTFAGLARHFGVAPPSLFRHVNGQDDLRQALAVAALDEYRVNLERAVMGKAGSEAVQGLATASRDWVLEHPGRYAAMVRAPAPDDREHAEAADRVLAVLAAVVSGYGITGEDAIDAIRFLRSALHGFATLESAGAFALSRPVGLSFDRVVRMCDDVLTTWHQPAIA